MKINRNQVLIICLIFIAIIIINFGFTGFVAKKTLTISRENYLIQTIQAITMAYEDINSQSESCKQHFQLLNTLHPQVGILNQNHINGNYVKLTYDQIIFQINVKCGSTSMYPSFACNDILWGYKPQSSDEIKAGDIIWFKGLDGQDIIHRVISVNDDGTFNTKGDSNNYIEKGSGYYLDPYKVNFSDIKGKVLGIAYSEN